MRFPPIIQGRQPQGAVRIDLSSQIAAAFRGGFVASFHQRGRMAHGGAFTSDTTARTASQGGLGLEIKSATAPDTRMVGTWANWLSGATQATFFCVFTPRSVPSGTTEERLFARWGVGAGSDQFIVQMYGSNIGVAVRSASFVEARRSSGVNLEAGKLYAAVCTWNASRSSTDRHRFWLNGANLTSVDWFVNGTAASINTSTSSELQFGQDNGGASRASNVVILAAGVTPVDIGNGAATEISANPWQLFEPERRIWVPVSVGGGSSVNLTIADALHTHAADALGLTSSHALAVADALHAHSAESPSLNTAVSLVIAEAIHAHAAEALPLTMASVLAVADALHGHLADALFLSDAPTLGISDSLHAHLADSLALTGSSTLAIAKALHAHTADGLALSSDQWLAIADALHAHAADALALTDGETPVEVKASIASRLVQQIARGGRPSQLSASRRARQLS